MIVEFSCLEYILFWDNISDKNNYYCFEVISQFVEKICFVPKDLNLVIAWKYLFDHKSRI